MATVLQLIALIVIATGVWFIYPPAAVICAGLFLMAFGLAWERVKNAGSST